MIIKKTTWKWGRQSSGHNFYSMRWNCSRAPDYDKLPPSECEYVCVSNTFTFSVQHAFFLVDSFSCILSAHLLLLFVASFFSHRSFVRSFVPFIRLFGCHNVLPFASRLWIICLYVCLFACFNPFCMYERKSERECEYVFVEKIGHAVCYFSLICCWFCFWTRWRW